MEAILAAQSAFSALHSVSDRYEGSREALLNAKNGVQIRQAAEEFEAVFISEMLKPMFETIDVNSEFGGGKGEEIFRGLMVQEYGKILSQNGGVGLSDHLVRQMIAMQEG